MNRMYLRNARKTIRRHGVFIQGVLAESPLDEPWTYSVGFQLLDPPRPEVIIVGVEVHSAGRLVNEVYKRVRDGTAALQPGELLSDFEGFPDTVRLRVDPVLAQWAETHVPVAGAVLDREAAAVPCVQLVWPDVHGRWPEEVGTAGCLRHHQPLLARDPAWLVPVEHTAAEDVFFDQSSGDARIAMPVYTHLRPEGRYEVLSAHLDDGRAVIAQVPWLADYVAYGDVVEVAADAEACRTALGEAFTGVARGGALVRAGGYRTLAYEVRTTVERVGERLADVVADLTANAAEARASTTTASLHVNARDPDAVRAALRAFVRDGHLVETGPRSGPPQLPDHPLGACEQRHGHR
jgi:hypothetical protein